MEPADRRVQILRSARRVFARRGYHDTAVSDIVADAGIARGTLYLYFDGKREVFGVLLEELLHELDVRIRPVRLGPQEAPPLDQVRENVRRVIELLVGDPDNVRLLLQQASGLDRGSQAALGRFNARVARMIESSLEAGVTLGILRECDTRVVCACIIGMVKEVVERIALREGPAGDLDAVAGQIVQFGLNGILGIAKRP